MKRREAANFELSISRNRLAFVMSEILRLFVGRGMKWSVAKLCTATGVPERKIECAKREPGDGEHRHLAAEEIASILSALGPRAQSMYLKDMGTKAVALEACDQEPGTIMAILSRGTAEFVERGIDGDYDGGDRARLRSFADEMIETLEPFSSKARG